MLRRRNGHPLPGDGQVRPADGGRGLFAQAVRRGRPERIAAAQPAQRRHLAAAQPTPSGDAQGEVVDREPRSQAVRRSEHPGRRHFHPEHRSLPIHSFPITGLY